MEKPDHSRINYVIEGPRMVSGPLFSPDKKFEYSRSECPDWSFTMAIINVLVVLKIVSCSCCFFSKAAHSSVGFDRCSICAQNDKIHQCHMHHPWTIQNKTNIRQTDAT